MPPLQRGASTLAEGATGLAAEAARGAAAAAREEGETEGPGATLTLALNRCRGRPVSWLVRPGPLAPRSQVELGLRTWQTPVHLPSHSKLTYFPHGSQEYFYGRTRFKLMI